MDSLFEEELHVRYSLATINLFFIFILPLFGAIGGLIYNVSSLLMTLCIVAGGVLWLLFLAYLARLFVLIPKRLLRQLRALKSGGKAVTAEVVEVLR